MSHPFRKKKTILVNGGAIRNPDLVYALDLQERAQESGR